jgi:hypothetical protein
VFAMSPGFFVTFFRFCDFFLNLTLNNFVSDRSVGLLALGSRSLSSVFNICVSDLLSNV